MTDKNFDGLIKAFYDHQATVISARTKRGLRSLAKSGFWPGGKSPFGYELTSVVINGYQRNMLRIREEEAQTVRRAVELFISGESNFGPFGLKKIKSTASQLDLERRRTRSGSAWSTSAIRRMLSNPCYWGKYLYACDMEWDDVRRIAALSQNELERRGSHTVIISVPAIIESWLQFEQIQQVLTVGWPLRYPNKRR